MMGEGTKEEGGKKKKNTGLNTSAPWWHFSATPASCCSCVTAAEGLLCVSPVGEADEQGGGVHVGGFLLIAPPLLPEGCSFDHCLHLNFKEVKGGKKKKIELNEKKS